MGTGKDVPTRRPSGEIWNKGAPIVMPGYWNDPGGRRPRTVHRRLVALGVTSATSTMTGFLYVTDRAKDMDHPAGGEKRLLRGEIEKPAC